jgi:hypothetical protein
MFGCLLTVANAAYAPISGFTEIEDFEWGDLVADYEGSWNGLFSSSLSDCENSCMADMCCP